MSAFAKVAWPPAKTNGSAPCDYFYEQRTIEFHRQIIKPDARNVDHLSLGLALLRGQVGRSVQAMIAQIYRRNFKWKNRLAIKNGELIGFYMSSWAVLCNISFQVLVIVGFRLEGMTFDLRIAHGERDHRHSDVRAGFRFKEALDELVSFV